MPWNDGITGPALDIAAATNRRLRVMAGPGTGKSTAMKRRVARLLEEGCNPQRILAVTLTRSATKELKEDLHNMAVPGCDKVHVGTLHAFCLSILGRAGVLEYNQRIPRLLMGFEDRVLIPDLGAGFRQANKRIKAFEAAWARMQNEEPGWPTDPVDQAFHRGLIDWLKFHGAVRVGELVPLALQYLRNNPACDELRAFDHVIVDEYQDLNKAEQELIALLAAAGHCAVVGDEDQSIYSFRHAHPEGIREFNQRNEDTHDAQIDECRRCPKSVVVLADALILQNHPTGTVQRLVPRPENRDGQVNIVQWRTLDEEINGVAQYIGTQIAAGRNAGEFMVLSPSRDIGRRLRDSLRSLNVQAQSFYSEQSLDAERAQEAFELLTLLAKPGDRVALRFLVGSTSDKFYAGQYRRLKNYCEANGLSPRDALGRIVHGTLTIPGTAMVVARYVEVAQIIRGLAGLTGGALIDKLFPETEEWAKPIREALATAIITDEESVEDLHERLTGAILQPEVPPGDGLVRIMSLHKSKGLSSPEVIMICCVQGILPRAPNVIGAPEEHQRHLEEQRRLFYVGMTRTKDELKNPESGKLTLSSSVNWPLAIAHKQRVQVVRGTAGPSSVNVIASQFLGELGPQTPQAKTGQQWLECLQRVSTK
jgi:superfamily I DNA/RNA helicase